MELTLHSDAPVGASSGLSLAGLHFPHLCGLVFQLSVGVKPFVLQLEVLACKLPAPSNLLLSYFRSQPMAPETRVQAADPVVGTISGKFTSPSRATPPTLWRFDVLACMLSLDRGRSVGNFEG
ncbi:hypothetical protein H4582DRAFT_2059558 [Lactarius indigo]|nr:hypothetical protein H4582DRAFT_2059558 [Lactarius indigo]